MENNREARLHRLVSELNDGGLGASEFRELEQLLVDEPQLQDLYIELMSTHVGLSIVASLPPNPSGLKMSAPGISMEASDRIGISRRPSRRILTYQRLIYALTTVAAIVLVSFMVFGSGDFWKRPNKPVTNANVAQGIRKIPLVKKVSWIGPSFSSLPEEWSPIEETVSGVVPLRVDTSHLASGYIFCLPPRSAVKLFATFDATAENCLTISELRSDVSEVDRKAVFHNTGAGDRPLHANPTAVNRRFGVLGEWSERNDTDQPRFFMLTGAHKLVVPEPNEEWRLSNLAVLLNEPDLVHLGWDDSGPFPGVGGTYVGDGDFDDLAVTLCFEIDEQSYAATSPISTSVPAVSLSGEIPSSEGVELSLEPGESVLLKVAADATFTNALVVLDKDTQQQLWATWNEEKDQLNLGACYLRNHGGQRRELVLVGINRHNEKPDEDWLPSRSRILFEQGDYTIIGFDDSKKDNDFKDILVSVLRIPINIKRQRAETGAGTVYSFLGLPDWQSDASKPSILAVGSLR
ncbi:MAG TPA: hypothetical protein PKD64_13025 [Pirellulaceae bacterium]|nr:hypothetical protein [Pirellulaceae bacterium]HMO93109.1 hypothetical protein [Pirellulaceae bacterium]HMP70332.1 hypothetical protein [Pirellulaceae bacterium]